MKKKLLFTILITISLCFAACSKQDTTEIVQFQNSLNNALYKIEQIHEQMNTMDVTAPDAPAEMLNQLTKLTDAFDKLADIKITDSRYTYISDLALEGSDYMNQALAFFQTAYGSEVFDEDSADLGYQYIERASKRVRMIVTMLHDTSGSQKPLE